MNEPDEAMLSRATAAALAALRNCTLTELGAIELFHFRRVKAQVAKCTAEAAKARVAAEIAAAEARADVPGVIDCTVLPDGRDDESAGQ